jgi:hypothetical protein
MSSFQELYKTRGPRIMRHDARYSSHAAHYSAAIINSTRIHWHKHVVKKIISVCNFGFRSSAASGTKLVRNYALDTLGHETPKDMKFIIVSVTGFMEYIHPLNILNIV